MYNIEVLWLHKQLIRHADIQKWGRAGVQAVRRTEGTDGRAGTRTDGQTHRHVT